MATAFCLIMLTLLVLLVVWFACEVVYPAIADVIDDIKERREK